MKFLSCLAFVLSFNAWAAPCGGEAVGYWTNPDGSRGGWVGKDAKVEAGAYIAPTAEVCESARVQNGAKVLELARIGGRAVISSGAVIDGHAQISGEAKIGGGGPVTKVSGDARVEGSAVITGKSNVFARAKVGGGARVHNSIICQASVIQSIQVIDSEYYCQTEDSEPTHPGEGGMKTLLGVDSDRDGVRDDLEIWINDKFSNTPLNNNANFRMAFKQYAKAKNEIIINKNDKAMARLKFGAAIDAMRCVDDFTGALQKNQNEKMKIREEADSDFEELDALVMNTPERVRAEFAVNRLLDGEILGSLKKTKSGCYFEKIK